MQRRLRLSFICGGALVLCALALWLLLSNSELDQAKARLRAAGEKLDLQDFSPTHDALSLAPLRTAAAHFSDLADWPGSLLSMSYSTGGVAKAAWQQAKVPLFEDTASWAVLREDIAQAEPGLQECREVLAAPPLRTGHVGFSSPYAFSSEWGRSAKWLQGAVIAQLHDDQLDQAAANLIALINAVRVYQDDLHLSHQLIRCQIADWAIAATWEALLKTEWTETQLRAIQEAWQQIHWLQPLTSALEAYRASGLSSFQKIREHPENLNHFGGMTQLPQPLVGRLWAEMWSDADELCFLRTMQGLVEAGRAAAGAQGWHTARIRLKPPQVDPRRFFLSAQLLVAPEDTIVPALRLQTLGEILKTIIALRRYKLRHQHAPTELAALIPDFLDHPPIDFMDGQPLRYRCPKMGVCSVYSVGWNGADDQGAPNPRQNLFPNPLWDGPDLAWPAADE